MLNLKEINPPADQARTNDVGLLKEIFVETNANTLPLKHNTYIGDWRVAVKGAGDGGELKFSEDRKLTVTWPNVVKRLRLEQNMDIQGLDLSDGGYKVSLRIELSKGFKQKNPLEWAAILASNKPGSSTGFLFVHTFDFSEEISDTGVILQATAQIDKFDADRTYQFCIQLKPEGGEVTLQDISLSARPDILIEMPSADNENEEVSEHASSILPFPVEENLGSALPRLRPKALVIAWDMGHNPVGRAFLIADMLSKDYDVELIGPQFDKYGKDVWAPIRNSSISYRAFPATSMSDFLERAVPFVAESRPDIVIACKARLPSILLALMIKYKTACPVLIDVDDHELSFFANCAPIPLADVVSAPSSFNDLDVPYGETWTRVCETLVSQFDGVIVSNARLQDRFGGLVVRHARNERLFRRDAVIKGRVRQEFGFVPKDKVILFLGTPRAHKGIFRIAEALEKLRDPNLTLCVIGSSNDRRIDKKLEGLKHARIKMFPDQPWERLNELINMADGVCLLQDLESPVSEYQIPAKLTDALATGVPVAVTEVAPFRDIPAPQIVVPIRDDADLEGFLKNVAGGVFDTEEYRTRVRQYFIGEMSYAVNSARLEGIAEFAKQKRSEWSRDWSNLFRFIGDKWQISLPSRPPEWAQNSLAFPALVGGATFDVAFFWKQNDTGIYGRRHDMVLKYLAKHPRVGRIIQFDSPVTPRDLSARVRLDEDAGLDQGNLVVDNTLKRFMRIADTDNVARRVFMHRGGYAKDNFLGQDLLSLNDYPQWVEDNVRETLGTGPVVSWVAPIARGYPAVHDHLNFSFTVADLIDDQRTMTEPSARERAHNSYVDMVERADLILSNCDSLKETFQFFGRDITVIPNAAERIQWPRKIVKPYELDRLDGKIIGYVGNLRDRIDIDLIAQLAERHPEWNLVLIGSAHGKTDVLTLRRYKNVHFLGVKPYEEALRYIRAFDVAIMPHLDNEISKSMNPLKLYVYLSAGVPIVTTSVSNIDDVAPFASVASDRQDFIARVEQTLARPHAVKQADVPQDICWESRIDGMIQAIDDSL